MEIPGERNFSDFLTAFEAFGKDNFTPPVFNTWVGLSVIAGALERKVWTEWNQSVRYYPNLFIMLVGLPGCGKTTAINRGVSLLTKLYDDGRRVNLLPTQATEAKMIELMGHSMKYTHRGKELSHSSGYYFASEASDSFKEIYGDITSTMTNFYDCPDFWEKATKKDGRLTINNACMNVLGGATFQYLNELVNQNNVMGGFASRLNYIICRDNPLRRNTYPVGDPVLNAGSLVYKQQLIQDLKHINNMVGDFGTTAEFREAWEDWDYSLQKEKIGLPEHLQSLAVRVGTSMHKLCMVLSASESADFIIKLSHFEKAKALLEGTRQELPRIFQEARANNVGTADGLQNALQVILSEGPLPRIEVARKLTLRGHDPVKVESSLKGYLSHGVVTSLPDGRIKLI